MIGMRVLAAIAVLFTSVSFADNLSNNFTHANVRSCGKASVQQVREEQMLDEVYEAAAIIESATGSYVCTCVTTYPCNTPPDVDTYTYPSNQSCSAAKAACDAAHEDEQTSCDINCVS